MVDVPKREYSKKVVDLVREAARSLAARRGSCGGRQVDSLMGLSLIEAADLADVLKARGGCRAPPARAAGHYVLRRAQSRLNVPAASSLFPGGFGGGGGSAAAPAASAAPGVVRECPCGGGGRWPHNWAGARATAGGGEAKRGCEDAL